MVARLKLKGIDGRAPPGVNRLQLAAVALLRTAARKGEVVLQALRGGNSSLSSKFKSASLQSSVCRRHPQIDGELLKLHIPSLVRESERWPG
jgi:hypothetical protein